MCGIAGIAQDAPNGVSAERLLRMAAALRHRGPDGAGIYTRPRVGFAHVRLSIIDVDGGAQPITAGNGRFTIVYNGEVYNYVELRKRLETIGHRFRTKSDTEVVLRAYMEWRTAALYRFNGQFSFAIHDALDDSVYLARDRFGVRPLYYAARDNTLVFGSEVKALFASGLVPAEPDREGIDEVLTCWAARAPRTVFKGVRALPPGSWAVWRYGRLNVRRWFTPEFDEAELNGRDLTEELAKLLEESVLYRMRSDVPVGAYLSGGIDSTATSYLASRRTNRGLRSYSVTFDDPSLNEAPYQEIAAQAIGTEHYAREVNDGDIADVFPEVVRHAETPLLRTAPAPMFLLARLARQHGTKVVLTGEGADELFLGYDIFKEAAARRFCMRSANSRRAQIFDRLYPYMDKGARGEMWQKWFLAAGDTNDPLFSHMPRFLLSARIKDFYAPDMRNTLRHTDVLGDLRAALPPGFMQWPPANRAAYLEIVTLLEPHLLSSQGDRMSLAHGVEARYPFLDHRLFMWAAALPVKEKLRALKDKRVLRAWAKSRLPEPITRRAKQPYRAPDSAAFFGKRRPAYVDELLQPEAVRNFGYFDERAVSALVQRCRAGRTVSTRENQALVAVLSTHLWHSSFFAAEQKPAVPSSHQILLEPTPAGRAYGA